MLYYLQEGSSSPIFMGTHEECIKELKYHLECHIVSEGNLIIEED